MKTPPESAFSQWPPANYVNPKTHGPALLVLNSLFLALSTIIIGLRIYTRLFIQRWFGLDDALLCTALVFTIAMHAIIDVGLLKLGWDRHTWDLPLDWALQSAKVEYAGGIIFLIATNMTMLSIVAFYYRVSNGVNIKWFRYCLHGTLAYLLLTIVVYLLILIFECRPIRAVWTIGIPSKCLDQSISTFTGGLNKTILDFIISTLPIPLVLRLQLPKLHRNVLATLLGLGYIVTIAGVVRAYYSWKLFHDPLWDQMWTQYSILLASVFENNLALICCSIPSLRPLFEPMLRSAGFPSYTQSSGIRRTGRVGVAPANANHTNQYKLEDTRSSMIGKNYTEIHEDSTSC